jgi:Zn-finger nucleic acid-binding protein
MRQYFIRGEAQNLSRAAMLRHALMSGGTIGPGPLHGFHHTADCTAMTCENCGAPTRLSRDQGLMICDYCGSQTTPPMDEEGVVVVAPTKHNCPVCETPLYDAALESSELLYCTGCHGMLFDMEKFLPLLDVLREHRYWSRSSQTPRIFDADRLLHCPLCKSEMDEHLYGGGGNMDVDSCERCGVLWLDRGELSRIVAAPDRPPEPQPKMTPRRPSASFS